MICFGCSGIRLNDGTSILASPENKRLSRNDIPRVRTEFAKKQNQRCGLCGKRVRVNDRALDHDHASGYIRSVLHRDCNIILGKVENFVSRYGKRLVSEGRLQAALGRIVEYMETDWSVNPLHPSHKTAQDKLASKYRRLIKRSKKPETKQKYRDLLRKLK